MIELLQWDTDFFGWKTGQIKSGSDIEKEIKRACEEDYRLIYLFENGNYSLKESIVEQYDVNLVDRKVVYGLQLPGLANNISSDLVIEYEKQDLTDTLLQLAFESGKYSRFKTDTHFQNNEFQRMYQSWILQSVRKQNADHLYISSEGDSITGMVTLKIKDKTAYIGLIATLPGYQGKGLGRQLINRCIETAIGDNCNTLEVATQFDNKHACRFYKSCGFNVLSITNIYHFWL